MPDFVASSRVANVTVAQLPSASAAGAGASYWVTDSQDTRELGEILGSGGSVYDCEVTSDGTNWRITKIPYNARGYLQTYYASKAQNLDQFADVVHTSGILAISGNASLGTGSLSGTNTGDQDLSGYVLTSSINTLAGLNSVVADTDVVGTADSRLSDERVPTAAGLTSKFGTNKASIADGDKFGILDSAASDAPKHTLWSLIKSTLKTYFDSLYHFPGQVVAYAGSSAPTGWLLCYGQAVSRTTYADLFAIVGTSYGAGDGSTTFNVPDLRGRVAAGKDDMGGSAASRLTTGTGNFGSATTLGNTGGAQSVTLTSSESGLPAHNHTISVGTASNTATTGAATRVNAISSGAGTNTSTVTAANASAAHTNVQPTIILNYIIKH